MGCGMKCLKYLLFFFNFIFALCGIAIVTIGTLMMNKMLPPSEAFNLPGVKNSSLTLIIIGSVIFIIAFFGCCGAIRESHWMSVTFAIFLLTLLVIQVAIAVYLIVTVKDLNENTISNEYQKVFSNYSTNDASKAIVDEVQALFQCCGVNRPSDFNRKVPGSCCNKNFKEECYEGDHVYQTGCAPAIYQTLRKNGNLLGGVAIGIGAVEVFGIIFSLCLANAIKNRHRREYEV